MSTRKFFPATPPSNGGRIFGYTFFVYEGSKGVVGDLFVTNGNRLPNPREVELKLLTHVIETLQQSPESTVLKPQLLAHEGGKRRPAISRPGIPAPFRVCHGPGDWQTYRLRHRPPIPEVRFGRWTEADYPACGGGNYSGHIADTSMPRSMTNTITLAGSLRS